VSGAKRYWLVVPGLALMAAAPPVQSASRVAYLALWYAGLALIGAWLVLDIRDSRRRQA